MLENIRVTGAICAVLLTLALAGSSPQATATTEDDFTANVLSHGAEFVHYDSFAAETSPPPPIHQGHRVSVFNPGVIDLDGVGAGITIGGESVVTQPTNHRMVSIPIADGENNTEVLNAIRSVLIDRGLVVAPEEP